MLKCQETSQITKTFLRSHYLVFTSISFGSFCILSRIIKDFVTSQMSHDLYQGYKGFYNVFITMLVGRINYKYKWLMLRTFHSRV